MSDFDRCECGSPKRTVSLRCRRCWRLIEKFVEAPHMYLLMDGEPLRIADQSDEGRHS